MTSQRVVVVGSINVDLVLTLPALPRDGETAIATSIDFRPGGKGANQAAAAAIAGADVAMVGAVGSDDSGRDQLIQLVRSGVSVNHVVVSADAPTGTAVVEVDDEGNNRIAVAAGANDLVSASRVVEARGAIEQADVVLVSLEIPVDAVAAAIDLAQASGAVVILNPAPYRELPPSTLQAVAFLTPNQHEAASLLGLDEPSAGVLDALANAVSASRLPATLVSLGSAGAALVRSDDVAAIGAPAVSVVDTTGAGDTLNGVFAAHLAAGRSAELASQAAVDAASRSVTWVGTRAPHTF